MADRCGWPALWIGVLLLLASMQDKSVQMLARKTGQLVRAGCHRKLVVCSLAIKDWLCEVMKFAEQLWVKVQDVGNIARVEGKGKYA
jgi:hypothetical protein